MSNAVKWTDWGSVGSKDQSSKTRHARWVGRLQFAGCVLGLAGLAAVLPAPGMWPDQLAGLQQVPGERVAVVAVAEQAVLLAASVLVWALLLWSIAVAGALTAAGLPGIPGRCGRVLLSRIAPAAAGRLIAAAVGVSLIAGTSACAAPWATAGSQPGAATESSSTSAETAGAASITIDWPDAQDSAAGPVGSTATAATPAVTPPPTMTPETTQQSPPLDTAPAEAQPSDAAPTDTKPTDAQQTDAQPADARPPDAGPTGPQPATATPAGAPAPAGPGAVTVRGGDSLWSIAKAAMPASATDADIDTAWRAWYAANQAVIGGDPNVIQPGQLLSPPTTSTENGR